ncbi:MAG: TRAP transporter large permease subunit, partial [Deltaproteobacteria bacterium]|nr:TRAP transporter large permease subunit [Deltaproteobacteria bacterium]
MDFVVVGWIGIAVMVALILLGVPIGFALGGVGFAGMIALVGLDRALGVLNMVPYSSVAYFMWIAVPLFVLMGNLAFYGGVVTDLFRAARNWFGWMPGGLAIATVWGCAGFGAACGSSVAGAATMGQIALPEMLKHNYSPRLSTGCIASAGSLASLIPPSILMIVYGAITDTSVGKLFMAGFIPGILSAALYMIMIIYMAKRNPEIGP